MSSDQRVGVLGGGQLGRMMAQAASRLGVSLTVLDPGGLSSPAGMVSGRAVTGDFKDAAKVRELAAQVDVLTVEIEHVNAVVLAEIEKEGKVRVHPSSFTLTTLQDKLLQKRHLQKQAGVPLGDFADVPDAAALLAAGEAWGYPLMLKARTLAYDGRGNLPVKAAKDAAAAFEELSKGGAVKLYAERWCEFTVELAVMVARTPDGKTATYPVVETEQVDSMCHTVVAPARVPVETLKQAAATATAAVASLTGAGIFGVELFAMPGGAASRSEGAPRAEGAAAERPLGRAASAGAGPPCAPGGVLLNEIAPRPHNSGHYTMDACHTEQHEQHLRAVLGLPLGDPSLKVPAAAMLNVIGSADGQLETTLRPIAAALCMPRTGVHWYGKAPPKHRRKMGHVNVLAESAAAAHAATLAMQGGAAPPPPPRVGIIMGSDSDLPCMRVPVKSSMLSGNDSLLSIVQMPKGVPVATVAIHNAANAGLLAVRMLGMADAPLRAKMAEYMQKQEAEVLEKADKLEKVGFRAYLGE